jgi:hypothetical protein
VSTPYRHPKDIKADFAEKIDLSHDLLQNSSRLLQEYGQLDRSVQIIQKSQRLIAKAKSA